MASGLAGIGAVLEKGLPVFHFREMDKAGPGSLCHLCVMGVVGLLMVACVTVCT